MKNALGPVLLFAALATSSPTAEGQSKDEFQKSADEFTYDADYMVVVEPGPERPTVGPLKPTWCDVVAPETGSYAHSVASRIRRVFTSAKGSWFNPGNIQLLFSSICAYPDHPGFQKQAGYIVQLWVNDTNQSKEEAIKSLTLRAQNDKWKAALDKSCGELTIPDEASPEQEEMTKARRKLFCNSQRNHYEYWVYRGNPSSEFEWYIDRRASPPSELDRLTYVLDCLPKAGRKWTKDDWLRIGLCGNDVRALDLQKIEKETEGMSEVFKAIALESYGTAKAVLSDLERLAKDTIDSDEDYKKLIYGAPQAAWTQWVGEYAKHKPAMEATYSFEEDLWAPRKSAVKACWGKVEKGMIGFAKSGKFKSSEAFLEGVQGPIGYVLLNALGACYAVSAPASVGAVLLEVNKRTRVWRGPRTAARWAMVDTLADIKADRTRFPVQFGYFRTSVNNLVRERATSTEMTKIPSTGGAYRQEASGVVKKSIKAKDQKDTLQIDFKSESWMEDTHVCKETNKVLRIDPNGQVVYRRTCKSTGKKKKTFTPNRTLVHSWSAKGVKPNAFVKMLVPAGSNYGDRSRWGYPIEVYKTKQRKNLLNMYGFAL